MLYLASVLVSFLGVFIRIFQMKNVVGDHTRLAFFTAYLVAITDVATITFVVAGGWIIALTSGTGAAFGVVAGMYFHDKVVTRYAQRNDE